MKTSRSWLSTVAFPAVVLWLLAGMAAAAGAVDEKVLERKQEDQQRARAMARELISSILDIQIQQLEENGLQEMEIYRDIKTMRANLGELVDRGITERCKVIAGVGPVRSLRAYEFIRTKVPGVVVPEALGRRLRGVPADRVAAEGVTACVETIRALREIPGVAGVHVMAFGYERGIPEILERAGLGRRAQAQAG